MPKHVKVHDASGGGKKTTVSIKEYEVTNPVVALVGISCYKAFDDSLYDLPGVEEDIKKCIQVFNNHLWYDMEIVSNRSPTDPKGAFPITKDVLNAFFPDIRTKFAKPEHDALICVLWCVNCFICHLSLFTAYMQHN